MSPRDALVDHVLASAREAHPELDVPRELVASAVRAREGFGAHEELHAADLCVAAGCAAGVASALQIFEREHVARIGAWLGAIERDDATIDEVRQRVRVRLLVGEGGDAPRITDYSGRGPLGAWVRVVAIREHASLLRARGAPAPDDDPPELVSSTDASPELQALRARYASVVSDAFRAAFAALEARERTLLRLAYADDLSLDAIGRMYAVNKSTVSRWLAAARADVLAGALAYARGEIGGSDATIESLLLMVKTGITDGLREAFREQDDRERADGSR